MTFRSDLPDQVVRIGWNAPAKGTAGWLSEFRIWNRERSASEIRAAIAAKTH